MGRQQFADFVNRFDQRVVEFLVLKMLPHSIDNALPELLAAFFMENASAFHRQRAARIARRIFHERLGRLPRQTYALGGRRR